MRTIEAYGLDEWHTTPLTQDFESLCELAETYTIPQILQGLEELERQRAEHLLLCYTEQVVPPEERKQALFDYCAVSMAEEPLVPSEARHNPWEYPEWLVLAQSRLAEFIMADLDTRQILAETQLFKGNDDGNFLHNFANSISAAIVPQGAHDSNDKVFAVGILTGQIRTWVLPEIRADELNLA